MKTTITGTLEDWMKHDPDAMLINRKISYMSNGAYVTFPRRTDPQRVRYHAISRPGDYDDYADPYFLIGAGCPYVVTFDHEYFVSIETIYGSGTSYPIAKRHWNDPNWEKIDRIEDCYKD